MITNAKEALLLLVQKQQGQWNEAQSQIEPKLLEWFITMRYIRHVNNKWQITSDGVRQHCFIVSRLLMNVNWEILCMN